MLLMQTVLAYCTDQAWEGLLGALLDTGYNAGELEQIVEQLKAFLRRLQTALGLQALAFMQDFKAGVDERMGALSLELHARDVSRAMSLRSCIVQLQEAAMYVWLGESVTASCTGMAIGNSI